MSLHCSYQNSEFQTCSEGPSDRMGKPKFRWISSSGCVLKENGISKVELVVYNEFVILRFRKIFLLCIRSKSGHFETKSTLRMTLQAEKGLLMEANCIFSSLKTLSPLQKTEYSVWGVSVHTFASAVSQDKCCLKTQK